MRKLCFSSLSWHSKCFLQYHGMAHKHQSQTGRTARVTRGMLDTPYGNKTIFYTCLGEWFEQIHSDMGPWTLSKQWVANNCSKYKQFQKFQELMARHHWRILKFMEDQQPTDWETNLQILHTDFGKRKISVSLFFTFSQISRRTTESQFVNKSSRLERPIHIF